MRRSFALKSVFLNPIVESHPINFEQPCGAINVPTRFFQGSLDVLPFDITQRSAFHITAPFINVERQIVAFDLSSLTNKHRSLDRIL